MGVFDVELLTRGLLGAPATPTSAVRVAEDARLLDAAHALRHETFVVEQGLFAASDRDEVDDDPRALTLVALDRTGAVVGTVRLAPALPDPDLGWWAGSRLAVARPARGHARGVGAALVRAACAHAERLGALRFDAHVQAPNAPLFRRLGWTALAQETAYGHPHVLMTWPVDRVARLAARTKAPLGPLLSPFGGAAGVTGGLGGAGFVGDDAAPVPGSDLVAATDAILPSMVERDPTWAGWCAVLVNLNDVAAMGATPVALLDALGARDASFASRVVRGVAAAARAWDVPVLGGHTQLGVPASLSVTALGRTSCPVPAGGGRPGHTVTVTADLGGAWRPGYTGAQWDSTSARSTAELQTLGSYVARTRPAAAKDVSMAGLVGTLGMLAEASGCGAVLDVADVPTPAGVTTGDWLTCFPGFAMITTDRPGRAPAPAGPATSRACGTLTAGAGVDLRWPDGRSTPALTAPVTGLGPA